VNNEVVPPKVLSRMEEAHKRTGLSVERTDIAPFPCVAPETGIGEVLGFRSPTMFATDDVVYLVSRVRIVFMKEAILTAIASAFCYESPQRLTYVTAQAGCVAAPAPSP
jgi:hypothetical protein